MFEENENLVTDVTENVEQQTTEENVEEEVVEDIDTTEQSDVEEVDEQPKGRFYTDDEIKKMKIRAKERGREKAEKEYKRIYSRLETVVNTGLGTSNVEEATSKLESFYEKKGITIPKTPMYSDRDLNRLGEGDAQDIIDGGFDEVVEEVERLMEIGYENMTPRDKAMFQKLATYRQEVEEENDLRALGIGKEEINSSEFKDYAKKLNPELSLKEKYEMYSQIKPKKEINQIGSVKSGMTNQVKDHYTQEEIAKLSLDDLDDPQVWEAVRKSMTNQN